MAAKKKMPEAKAAPDRLGGLALLASGLSLILTVVFIFCTSAELKSRPTFQQVLEGFKEVDKKLESLEKK